MSVQSFFPTRIYAAPLQRQPWKPFNDRLLLECLQMRHDDVAGQRWSSKNYPGGYTSYGSVSRMQQISPTFALLEKRLARHVKKFAAALEFDLADRPLVMTDCWVNIMPHRTAHSLHLHPNAVVSGTYYVATPKGCAGLKFEDPRMSKFMAAPPRLPKTSDANRLYVTYPAEAGKLLLFESWLRHEVVANPVKSERLSISFNYDWA